MQHYVVLFLLNILQMLSFYFNMAIIYNANQNRKKEILIKHLVLNNKYLILKIKQLTKELSMLKKTYTCNLPIDKKKFEER